MITEILLKQLNPIIVRSYQVLNTYKNILNVVLVDGDSACVHEVQQQPKGLRIEVLEDHGTAVLLEEAGLEHPVKVGGAGAEDELVRRELPALRHQHCVCEPLLKVRIFQKC